MSNPNPDSTPTTAPDEQLPIIYIVFIAFGVYIFIFVTGLVIRQLLMKRGLCANNSLFGKEGDPCCECCVACGESCNCFSSPSLEGCLDSICPARRTMSFSEIVQCRCCNDPNQQCCGCCGGEQPLCDFGNCNCQCGSTGCENCDCLCFSCKLKDPPPDEEDED